MGRKPGHARERSGHEGAEAGGPLACPLGATAITLYGCWLMVRPFLGVLTGAVVRVITFHLAGLVFGPVLLAVTLRLLDVIRQTGRPADAIRRDAGLPEHTALPGDKASAPAGGP